MKRSPLQRKTPLRATAFKPKKKEPKPFPIADPQQRAQQSSFKRRARKKPTVEDGSKYLAACRGERCYLRTVCGGDASPDIVVPCHSNQSKHGKGMGKKAEHVYTVPGCYWCHMWLDQGEAPRAEKFATWDRAYAEWKFVREGKMELETA
jgi:hypothetical protein